MSTLKGPLVRPIVTVAHIHIYVYLYIYIHTYIKRDYLP